MEAVWGADEAVAGWVAAHIPGCERGFERPRSLGVLDSAGNLVGGIVYHNWNPERGIIEMSGAATDKRWLTRSVIRAAFTYPFAGAGCQTVYMLVSERNQTWNGRGLISGLRRFGFAMQRIPRLFGRDEDGLFFTLTDDAWNGSPYARQP